MMFSLIWFQNILIKLDIWKIWNLILKWIKQIHFWQYICVRTCILQSIHKKQCRILKLPYLTNKTVYKHSLNKESSFLVLIFVVLLGCSLPSVNVNSKYISLSYSLNTFHVWRVIFYMNQMSFMYLLI